MFLPLYLIVYCKSSEFCTNFHLFKFGKLRRFSSTIEVKTDFVLRQCPRKKTSLEQSLAESHAYNPIRDSGETLGERESLAKSLAKSLTESLGESLG